MRKRGASSGDANVVVDGLFLRKRVRKRGALLLLHRNRRMTLRGICLLLAVHLCASGPLSALSADWFVRRSSEEELIFVVGC